MKTLVLLLIWTLLPISVNAGVKFETYNAADVSWDIDTTCIVWDDLSIMDSLVSYDIFDVSNWDAITVSTLASGVVTSPKPKHDTLREYVTGLDTVIIMHRIECDTNFTKFFVENDSTFVQIEGITCDTIFRVEYRDAWAPKVQAWLDSLQWQKLLRILDQ